ncbi:MAG: hypothetical protein KDJ29_10965 [Hyphomicrobiales bacterium]|nr:hypothetical protein [Hyphomicrobiales bacterium]
MKEQTLGSPAAQGQARKQPDQSASAGNGAEKWPPHLLQAKAFRPNVPPEEAMPASGGSFRFLRHLAFVAVAAGLGWGGYSVWQGYPGGGKQVANAAQSAQTKELQKLAREEKNTLTRVLSDLRILQSAFANLQGQVANLPAKSDMDRVRSNIASLHKSVSTIAKRVAAARNDQSNSIAALKTRVDAAEKAAAQQAEALGARIARLEQEAAKRTSAAMPVASINTSKVARSVSASAPAGGRDRAAQRKRFGYVVRDVHRGIAIVENRNGDFLEVYPGVNVPGAGRVRSIRRRGRQWEVVTSRGTIDSSPY